MSRYDFKPNNFKVCQKKSEGSLDFQDTDRHQCQMPSGQGLGQQSDSKDITAK